MREWLTVIIVLLIIGILLDGIRRMRAHRRETLRLSKNMLEVDALLKDDHSTGSEFPSGGARIAAYREATDAENIHQNVRESYAASKLTRGAKRSAEQSALNLDTPVPLLMESVRQQDLDDDACGSAGEFDNAREPRLGNLDDLDDDATDDHRFTAHDDHDDYDYEQAEVQHETPAEPVLQPAHLKPSAARTFPEPDHSDWDDDGLSTPRASARKAQEPARPATPKVEAALPDEVLVMNVMAKRGEVLLGEPLLETLVANGMRFGDMDIFHRFETSDGRGKVLFSLANIVKPGTFDLDTISEFETPGVSLFLTLPSGSDSLQAYDLMAQTAQELAACLGGELKDENRSVMTRQTIEHGRQRVVEYERKRRLAKA